MKADSLVLKRLSEYQKPNFLIKKTDLTFTLNPAATQVTSCLLFKRNTDDSTQKLVLDGCDLIIIDIKIDGLSLKEDDYQ